MSNGSEHRLGAAACLGAVAAANWREGDHWMAHPVTASALGWACGTLPDVFEPATSPNHRQFLHSLAFAGLLVFGLRQIYQWESESTLDRIVRHALLIAGGAYCIHLAMDALTAKSLPIIGRA